MSNENLQKQFLEDAPQAVDNLSNVQDLSDCVIRLQKIEDEIKQDEENLKLKLFKTKGLISIVVASILLNALTNFLTMLLSTINCSALITNSFFKKLGRVIFSKS